MGRKLKNSRERFQRTNEKEIFQERDMSTVSDAMKVKPVKYILVNLNKNILGEETRFWKILNMRS